MLFLLRMLLMGVHFVLAGVLGVILGLCRPFNPDNSRLCARLYAWPAMCILRLRVKAEVDTLVNKSQSCVIIANHQSNYDLFVFGNVVPYRTVCIGKKSLKWVPLFGQLFWLAGNVLIDRGNAIKARQSMLTTTHTLQHEDTSIWVFPEGTRNLGEDLLPFKKGAFQMAIAAGVPIVPVCVSSYIKHMRLNRWRGGDILIRSLPAIPTAGLSLDDMPQLIAQCREQMRECIAVMDRQVQAV
ncbi:1-acylglycerol-3-phosphate O-acyltransferase [Pseudomonas sp. Fig-3]|jgi:1-acyl-sn-glycerol-3-phosphate acyltransferase|uniref:1-acyl-sn-glycerol-3-phosphate acyltransferase n=1 Tax=Pseudomonas rhizophila TaxID=2045200 RepID=A0ABM6UE53_9PSED|nr:MULTISPECIES: 1-acylglycerol-3-phosphate O-acyltransferase [Pseudomonas]AVU75739.1 1-acyl-sn-glycerol-3-phosphate acyltransferase [Pseudomonas rhizophila]MBD0705423.1 1-acyl-sn-glycerol-3-phosphate acyltransferase [Pseudomonas sp. PSB1]MDD2033611.1 1-acylglycerol-3-phosphate O-acyltransferase [Pseudomonas sp. 39167]MDR8385605.1 1-acylglycerol-3-phosphate O-acyltransferase [Pseudomonas sp. JL2]MXR31120.1 1-acylglycerol-3-phosphate O-acyltransferase [Pseudomonas sp. PICF6]